MTQQGKVQQSKSIADIVQPKQVTTICENHGKTEAMIHCTGMACNGYRAYFCYTPKKKQEAGDYQK